MLQSHTSSFARGLAACLVFAGLAVSSVAHAQPSEETGEASFDSEARSLFEAGRTAFNAGRFEDARDHFRHAYQLSGRAELLYNVAQSEDRLQNEEAALQGFEAYLAALPDAGNRAAVEARIESLRRVVDARAESERLSASDGGPTVVWGWIAGATALVTGGLAVTFWILANDEYDALADGCRALRGGCTRQEVSTSDVEELVTVTNVMLVTTLVATAALSVALPLELLGGGSTDSPSAELRIGPGHISIVGAL